MELLRWDVFCRVIDNFGDIGVCWRLCADLAQRGHSVRLWVDEASALRWMAPGALEGRWPGVAVHAWNDSCKAEFLSDLAPSHVWVEGFGCEIAPEFIAHYTQFAAMAGTHGSTLPVWINLEYLSAESYVERVHGLPSPVMSGPGRGMTKHFYYPGFHGLAGGLLREPGLLQQQAAHDRHQWLSHLGIEPQAESQLVSLFCYTPPALPAFLKLLEQRNTPTQLLVTPGQATQAVRKAIEYAMNVQPSWNQHGLLSISYLPFLSQQQFDRLLWSCDLNCVRGEDSLVRAIWAGKPLLWQIYPQSDAAHHGKLDAFLHMLKADATLRQWHHVWNGLEDVQDLPELPLPKLEVWQDIVSEARIRLMQFTDLATGLVDFVLKKR